LSVSSALFSSRRKTSLLVSQVLPPFKNFS
jgi:hypothetical protein